MAANARGSATHTATRRRAYQDGALRPEWQCRPCEAARSGPSGSTPSHCHSTSSVPKRYVQGRVAVSSTRNCTLRAEWQCRPHCHSTSNVPAARPHTATRRRAYQDGALRPEWQCRPCEAARSGPSGSTPSHCHSTSSVPKMSR